jgi:hypothetical protein
LNPTKTASILWDNQTQQKKKNSLNIMGGILQQGTLAELLWRFVGKFS